MDCKYITYEHFYQIHKYNVDANLLASDNGISGNEPSLEMLRSRSKKLEWTKTGEVKKSCHKNKGNVDIKFGISNYFQ